MAVRPDLAQIVRTETRTEAGGRGVVFVAHDDSPATLHAYTME